MGSIEHAVEIGSSNFSSYEQVYLKMSRAFAHLNKEHWGIHCVCSIDYRAPAWTDEVAALRTAWTRLAIEYPGLRMVPIGLHKQYSSPDESSMLQWAQKTFTTSDLTADEIIAEARLRDLPTLYYLPASSELVLLIQHWRADGLGSCMLLDRLFEILTESAETLDASVRPKNLPSPSLEDAAGASGADDPELQTYAKSYIDSFHAKAVHAGGLPLQGEALATTTPPSRAVRRDLDFSSADTAAIVATCTTRGISVSAAIHAALARAVLSYLPEQERGAGYTTVMAVNMRPHLPAPYNGRAHACQTYVASITPTVPYDKDGTRFVDAARALSRQYRTWCSPRFLCALRWIYDFHLAKLTTPPNRSAGASPPPKPPSGVTLSSLGVVERYLKESYGPGLSVTRFRFGVSMMTRQTILYAWTFRGRLTLSLSYNEAYYSDVKATEVLSHVAMHLKDGLGIIKA